MDLALPGGADLPPVQLEAWRLAALERKRIGPDTLRQAAAIVKRRAKAAKRSTT